MVQMKLEQLQKTKQIKKVIIEKITYKDTPTVPVPLLAAASIQRKIFWPSDYHIKST